MGGIGGGGDGGRGGEVGGEIGEGGGEGGRGRGSVFVLAHCVSVVMCGFTHGGCQPHWRAGERQELNNGSGPTSPQTTKSRERYSKTYFYINRYPPPPLPIRVWGIHQSSFSSCHLPSVRQSILSFHPSSCVTLLFVHVCPGTTSGFSHLPAS